MHGATRFILPLLYSCIILWLLIQLVTAESLEANFSESASAASTQQPPTRRSVLEDWREITAVVAGAGLIYILKSFASGQAFIWAWKRPKRLRVLNADKNEKNQLKFRRYTSPIHLPFAVLIDYLWENIYFVVVFIFQLTCDCSPTGRHSTYPGLIVAFAAKLILVSVEEYSLWSKERELNSAKYKQINVDTRRTSSHLHASALVASSDDSSALHWGGDSSGVIDDVESGEIRRGKVVLVLENGIVPVDGIILASSEKLTTPVLFNEAGLTGESAPAAKFPINIGLDLARKCSHPQDYTAVAAAIRDRIRTLDPCIEIEKPNSSSLQFSGTVFHGPSDDAKPITTFTAKNAAFRGSILHGSKWVLILSVYTGHQTKAGLAFVKKTGVKDTPLNKQLGTLIRHVNLPFIAFASLGATAYAKYLSVKGPMTPWQMLNVDFLRSVGIEWIANFLFLNGLNNLSTRFFGDIVRIGQCHNMKVDSHNFIEYNRNIPDSLGNVQVIISDKTGTITKNELKCEQIIVGFPRSLSGSSASMVAKTYQVGSHDLSNAMFPPKSGARRASLSSGEVPSSSSSDSLSLSTSVIMSSSTSSSSPSAAEERKMVNQFVTFMAVANAVMPKVDESSTPTSTGSIRYISSNPDDLEFVKIAKSHNIELMERYTDENAKQFVRVRTPVVTNQLSFEDETVDEEVRFHDVKIRVMYEHEFVSSRKYMSTVLEVPAANNQLRLSDSLNSSGEFHSSEILLVLKGADAVVEKRLSVDSPFKQGVQQLVRPHTNEGKRVLVWAYKFIPKEQFKQWEAKRPQGENDAQVEEWWSMIEKDLEFAGCTVVSDKLQDGVEEVIAYARECGIKVVMATGDSADTAESIWRKLRQIQGPVYRLVYSEFLRAPDPAPAASVAPAQAGSAVARAKAPSLDMAKLNESFNQFDKIKLSDRAVLILDSDMLASLDRPHLGKLAKAMCNFDSVVAARMTAAQKAQINRLYQRVGRTTLAIGDGANDITMIQEATVSVGLKSAETDAAANTADFKVQEFRNLQGLLVYGLQNYFRLSTVYLWNDYKAIVLALVPFLSRLLQGFQGESIIPGDLIFMLTTVVLSLPVVIYGIYDVPISVAELVEEPVHYKEHRHKRFDGKKKAMWWISAMLHTGVILYTIFTHWLDKENALVVGVLTSQIIAVVTNIRLVFESRRFFHLSDSWRLLIASFASALLTVPISNLNPAFDGERRLKLGGTLDLPKLSGVHMKTVLMVAAVCFMIDVFLYYIFGEDHIISNANRARVQPVVVDDLADEVEPIPSQ